MTRSNTGSPPRSARLEAASILKPAIRSTIAGLWRPRWAGRDRLERNGPDSAQNQGIDTSFIATEDYLEVIDPETSFPQFESEISAEYASGIAGPFDPHSGSSFIWSQRADEGYKRLARTITVPAGGATLEFWTSYNLEQAFDYMVVEAHTVGQDNWDDAGRRPTVTPAPTSTNDQSCPTGWSNMADPDNLLHPFLNHYQTFNAVYGTCSSHRQHRHPARRVERRERQLGRLAAVVDLDLLRVRPTARSRSRSRH